MGWLWTDDDDGDGGRNSGEISEYQDMNLDLNLDARRGRLSLPSAELRRWSLANSSKSAKKLSNFLRTASEGIYAKLKTGKRLAVCKLSDWIHGIRPTEVVQSNKEYTEEDVTEQITRGSSRTQSSDITPFDFPGLRSDIEAIERNLFDNMDRFFEAAEDTAKEFFGMFGSPNFHDKSSFGSPRFYDGDSKSSSARGVPIEPPPSKVVKPEVVPDGQFDLSGLARDV